MRLYILSTWPTLRLRLLPSLPTLPAAKAGPSNLRQRVIYGVHWGGAAAGQRLVQPLDVRAVFRRRAGHDAVGVLPHDAGGRLCAGYVDWSWSKRC